jgi:ribosomal protein S18 acetylase RimI-like enzyme
MPDNKSQPESVSGLVIRRATEGDAALLSELALRIFMDTFGPDNDPADMKIHADRSYRPDIQLAELREKGKIYLIAEVDGVPAGFAMLGDPESASCDGFDDPIELFRFYVDKAWHGRGIARPLMDAVIDLARELGGETICLGVWEKNPRAMRFYEKVGFRDVGSQPYLLGNDLQTDRVMVLDIG